MRNYIRLNISEKVSQINQFKTVLEGNDPRRILKNGYAILEDSGGNVVAGIGDMVQNNCYKVTLSDGSGLMEFIEEVNSHEG